MEIIQAPIRNHPRQFAPKPIHVFAPKATHHGKALYMETHHGRDIDTKATKYYRNHLNHYTIRKNPRQLTSNVFTSKATHHEKALATHHGSDIDTKET